MKETFVNIWSVSVKEEQHKCRIQLTIVAH